VNALDWTERVTLDIIGRVAFGFDFQCGTSPVAKEIHHMWRQWVDNGLSDAGFTASMVLRAFPFLASLPFKSIKAQGALRERLKELVRPLAEERVAAALAEPEGGLVAAADDDLMGYLIRASVRDGQSISIDALLDHMNTFVQTGHETTAGVLSYTSHALARHPDVQDKLRAELEEFGREPNYDDLHNPKFLPYLDAVTKEALRLFPAGAHTERVAVKDDVIQLSNPVTATDGTKLTSISIKKGQVIYLPFLSMNTHSAVWGSDGKVFRPSRWLDTESTPIPKVSLGGWQNIASFGEGPRMCVGWRLALFEFKAILSGLVRNIRFVDTGLDVETKSLATMQPYVLGDEATPEMKEGVFMPVRVALVDRLDI